MSSALRRHPRVPLMLPCTLRNAATDGPAIQATTFTVAGRGVGLRLDGSHDAEVSKGSVVAVEIEIDSGVSIVVGTVAWIRHSPHKHDSMGIELGNSLDAAPPAYREWVDRCFATLREESYALVANLASDGVVYWRTLQDALDRQERDGGYLCDHLDGVDVDNLPS